VKLVTITIRKMDFIKKTAPLFIGLLVSLIVSAIVYFIILLLPILLFNTSNWADIGAGTMKSYAIVGAVIVFVCTALKVYKELKGEWSSDGALQNNNQKVDSVNPEDDK